MLSAPFDTLHAREWARLARSGTWLTGEQRVGAAFAARGGPVHTPIELAARRIYEAPATITQDWLLGLETTGLSMLEYVEVIGIIARLRALDTLVFGHGLPLWDLPTPEPGQPTRQHTDAIIDGGWVPTVGAAFPTTILSAVPAENEAMEDVHATLYLAPTGDRKGFSMGNINAVRDRVGRSEMEFVAARTSLLNDCFF